MHEWRYIAVLGSGRGRAGRVASRAQLRGSHLTWAPSHTWMCAGHRQRSGCSGEPARSLLPPQPEHGMQFVHAAEARRAVQVAV